MEAVWIKFQTKQVEQYRSAFMDLQKSLWTSMVSLFPQEQEFQTFLSQVTFAASNSVTSIKFVNEWFSNMEAVASDVSYAKPFKRLTGRDLTYFDVTKYKDYKSLLSVPVLKENIKVDLVAIFESPAFEPHRKYMFVVLRELNELSSRAKCSTNHDSVPSRDDISAEIRTGKTKTKDSKGDIEMSSGLLSEVFSVIEKSSSQPVDESLRQLIERLKGCNLQKDWDIPSLHSLLSKIDMDSKDALRQVLDIDHPLLSRDDVRTAIENTKDERGVRDAISQFVSFNRVAGTISSGLLKAVKDELGDTQNYTNEDGSVDLSKVDVMGMMPRLMQNVDPEELQDMAKNLGSMMPELQKMAKATNLGKDGNMPEGVDLNALTSMMGMLGSGSGAGKDGGLDMGALMSLMNKNT